MAGKSKGVYNKATGRWEFPEPVVTKSGKASVYDPTIARLPISRAKIHEICVAVGFKAPKVADTPKGIAIQEATFVTDFIGVAIDNELARLKAVEAKPTPVAPAGKK